ncbi:uncharacterized protein M6D78_002279 isoform 5-T6 [Vipera latastei]
MDLPRSGVSGWRRAAPSSPAAEPEEGREAKAGARLENLPPEEPPAVSEPEHFCTFVYQELAGPWADCTRLQQLCHRWLKPERSTKAQVMDLVILEQFLALLPPEMAAWLRECGVESCSQAVALAEGFLLSQAEEQRQQMQEPLKPVLLETPEVREGLSRSSTQQSWGSLSEQDQNPPGGRSAAAQLMGRSMRITSTLEYHIRSSLKKGSLEIKAHFKRL